MHRFIDLFCGIGGFRVALQKEGMNCVFSCDIDRHARRAYHNNFKEEPDGDITEIRNGNIPKHDILCAGFPCQPFSQSGKHNGFSDDRGRLFYEIVRIAKYHKPYVMLLENVKNILTVDNGKVIGEVCRTLENVGYSVHYDVLNSSNFGIPQKRERVYFVCLRKDQPLNYAPPKATYRKRYLADILMPNNECVDLVINRDDIVITNYHPETKLKPVRVGYLNKAGQGERIYATSGHAITLSANGGGVGARTGLYLVDGIVRKLHILEAKKAMGFSVKHHVSKGIQGLKQLGNSIIPEMVNHVYERIRVSA